MYTLWKTHPLILSALDGKLILFGQSNERIMLRIPVDSNNRSAKMWLFLFFLLPRLAFSDYTATDALREFMRNQVRSFCCECS
jgi:hypothetical protein